MKIIKKGDDTVKVCETKEEALRLLNNLTQSSEANVKTWSIDFETTALYPEQSKDARVRITSIGTTKNTAWVIDHDLCGSFAELVDTIMDCGRFYVFNVNFEGKWITYYTAEDISRKLLDVAHMRRSVMGGGPWNLAGMAKKDLGIEVDKTEQNSAWSNTELTNKQYFYAGFDAIVTLRLGRKWAEEMDDGRWNGFWIINEAWRAVNEIQDTGMLIDIPYHRTLIAMWTKRRQASEKAFRKFVPASEVNNIRSKKQISDFLKSILDDDAIEAWPKTEKTGQLQTDRNILRSMSYSAPYPMSRVLAALMVFNRADKYLGTYGESLITYQMLSADGKIHSRLNMAQAITCRFSSSGPNQQNYPRAYNFRKSFKVDRGRKMCIADYSGVEIRVLAEVSGDKILLHDAIYDDVHTQSAIAIFKITNVDKFKADLKAKDPRAKELRSKAKAFTFQLLYGAGAGALAIALRCSVPEAEDAIAAWARRYSKAFAYRQYMYEKMKHDGFLPVISGRTIFVHRADRTMPVAANYPIQGAAADVMYAAIRHVQLILEERLIDAALMASIHDEVLVLSSEACAEDALEALEEGMRRGWLEVFPDTNVDNLAEGVIADRWCEKA